MRIPIRPAGSWRQPLAFLRHRTIPQVEAITETTYSRGALHAAFAGASVTVTAPAADLRRFRALFDLECDFAAIAAHLGRDPFLKPLLAACPAPRVPGCWDPFELAIRAVIGQQVSVRGASTIAGRLAARFGCAFPSPPQLAEADLAGLGLTTSRIAALRHLASAVAGGVLRLECNAPLEDKIDELCSVRGIGSWTAHYIAMRGLGYPDAFPATDLALERALPEIARRAERWRPWRAYAAILIWTARTQA
jgi:AraC family transcriptional regulator of adaptative response / DNA-3-methyladenine glycosylase II